MIEFGDCRTIMARWAKEGVKVQTCITSPPYFGLRAYGGGDQEIGIEHDINEYVNNIVYVFSRVWDLLKDDGTVWLNLGDSYAGSGKGRNPDGTVHVSALMAKQGTSAGTIMGNVKGGLVPDGLKPKDLIGVPWRVAFALQAFGWYLRQDIIWHKPNPMPESVKDRCTKAHEYIFLLSKNPRYYFDNEAIKEPVSESTTSRLMQNIELQQGSNRVPNKTNGNMKAVGNSENRNKRSVWTVNTSSYKGAHFATFPTDLIEPCVLASTKAGDLVLDPFMGSGTTAAVAERLNRQYIGCELNLEYEKLQKERLKQPSLELS
jgi:DNA modification methylase